MNEPEDPHGHRIKTEQQPNGRWKAWVVGTEIVNFAGTEVRAVIKLIKMILPDNEEDDDEE